MDEKSPVINEPIDQRLDRLKAEFYARPDAAELERKHNLEYGVAPIRPEDLEASKTLAEKEADWDSKIARWKAESQAEATSTDTSHASGIPAAVTPAEIQATETLRNEWGDQYQGNIEAGARALEGLFASRDQLEDYVQRSGILNNPQTLGDALRLLAKIGKSRR